MSTHRIAAVAFCCLLLGASSARAQDDETKAKSLYASGVGHYKKGDYKAAIRDLKAADDLIHAPALAFNIAQSYRQMGDCREALDWYRTYLDRDPLAKNKDTVNGYIANMIKCLPKEAPPPPPEPAPAPPAPETKPTVTPAPIPTTVTPPPPAPEPVVTQPAPPPPPPPEATPAPRPVAPPVEPVDVNPGHGKKVAGLALMGAGGALTVVGIVFGVAAKSNADDVSNLSRMGGTWTPEFADKESAGKRDSTIAGVGIGVGIAALLGGGVLYYLGATERPEPAHVSVGVHPGGGNVVFSWQY